MTAKKKLLLTYPNQRWHKSDLVTTWSLDPRTPGVLAACVRDLVDVKFVDAHIRGMSPEEFRTEVEAWRPDYVGISVLTSEYADILDVAARAVKSANPDIVVIAGGVHVTTQYDQVIQNADIDFCCRGEGEEVLRGLLQFLLDMGPMPTTGLVYRENGEVRIQERAIVEDLTKLPWPDYSIISLEDYIHTLPRYGSNRLPELPGINLTVSRGCPFKCSFCQVESISGRVIRMRDPDDIVKELAFLKERYGIRSFNFNDDNLFSMRKKAKRLLQGMVEKGLNLKWHVPGFALFTMDDEMLDLMRDAGCVGVNVAIESGNERVLRDIVRKPIKDLRAVPELIEKIKSRGMFVLANFIIGLPGETWDEILDTVRFAESCGADYVKFFVATPLVGTEMYEMARELGALDLDDGTPPEIDWRHSHVKSPDWSPMDVSALRVYEWDRINFSPERISRTAEIWGMPIEEINDIRKKTRRALFADTINNQMT